MPGSAPIAVVLSGHGRYADPWHDFPATSARIAGVLEECGLVARVVPTTPEALGGLGQPDVVVVNAGGGRGRDVARPGSREDRAWRDAHLVLHRLLDLRVPLLAVHAAANTFTDLGPYRDRLGGRWLPGTSFHPERGLAHLAAASDHPALGGAREMTLPDEERYSALEIDDDVTPLLSHVEGGVRHVLAWAREDRRGRVVYDGLGHHAASYQVPERKRLLATEVAWLLADQRWMPGVDSRSTG